MHAVTPEADGLSKLLRPIREAPGSSAVFCDIDGTLAPIVESAAEAAVPEDAREVLRSLADRYVLVGCLSGRAAEVAREIVGLDELTYIGNHGFERLLPEVGETQLDPAVAGQEHAAAGFLDHLDPAELDSAGLRVEDKGPIRALHWRGAKDEEGAEAKAREIANDAVSRNLLPHWGRKVLEIRPALDLNKGAALAELLAERRIANAVYGGDDRTDIDAFRRLRDLRAAGELAAAVCVGVASEEGPPELGDEADVMVDGTRGFLDMLRTLAS